MNARIPIVHLHGGETTEGAIDEAVRHVLVKQGMLGVKVKIMKATDPEGRIGPKKNLPDIITVHEPKEYPVPNWKPNQPVEKKEEVKEL